MRSAETELQNTIELRATASAIAAPKPDGFRRQSRKKTILKHFLKGFLKGKLIAPKVRKSADKSLSQPGCSHANTIRNLQLQKTIVLRKQPQHQATFIAGCSHFTRKNTRFRAPASFPTQSPCNIMQPFQCDLAPASRNAYNYAHRNKHCCKTHRRNQTTPAATAAQTR